MNGQDATVSALPRSRLPVGLYLVIAYCAIGLARLPFQLPLPEQLYIGPFLLMGPDVTIAIAVSAALWLLVLIALIVRWPWSRAFALGAFGAHVILLLAGAARWLWTWREAMANGYPNNYRVDVVTAFRIMGWPTLFVLLPSALAFFYVALRRDLFVRVPEEA